MAHAAKDTLSRQYKGPIFLSLKLNVTERKSNYSIMFILLLDTHTIQH